MSSSSAMSNDEKSVSSFRHWRIYKAVTALENDGLSTATSSDDYQETIGHVVTILRQWASMWAGKPEWQSFLNRPSFLHEAEESIVALHHLHQWMLSPSCNQQDPIIVVDACCGKGLFSMLLSYLMASDAGPWKQDNLPLVSRIVMLDRATSDQICWNHVHMANNAQQQEQQTAMAQGEGQAERQQRPIMELWEGCNLHDYDAVLEKLENLHSPLALVGIHLCKTLGPSCISLVNGLGPKRCPYLCLAPCCLPRVVTSKMAAARKKNKSNADDRSNSKSIPIHLYETDGARRNRLEANQRRNEALGRRRKNQGSGDSGICCYLCLQNHRVRDCPQLPHEQEERIAMLKEAAKTIPCWKCGVVGHFRADCSSLASSHSSSTLKRPPKVLPPTIQLHVEHVLQSSEPFDTYCQLLADKVQDCSSKQMVETGLINASAAATQHQEKQGNNWNWKRKSVYIVVSR